MTVRAEISRLRRVIGPLVTHQPCRLVDGARMTTVPDPAELPGAPAAV